MADDGNWGRLRWALQLSFFVVAFGGACLLCLALATLSSLAIGAINHWAAKGDAPR